MLIPESDRRGVVDIYISFAQCSERFFNHSDAIGFDINTLKALSFKDKAFDGIFDCVSSTGFLCAQFTYFD